MKTKSESTIQSECVQFYRNTYCLKHHTPRCVIFQVPNEIAMELRGILLQARVPSKTINNVTAIVSQRMKNMGMLSGVSDTVLTLPNGRTLFIEFKTPDGRQQPNQIEFQSAVESTGHKYYVVRSLEQFQDIISHELNL